MTALYRTNSRSCSSRPAMCLSLLLLLFAMFVPAGCKRNSEVDDPQLKPIQEMLNQNVPAGSTESAVNYFLDMRGYPREAAPKRGTLVAIIRHIDTEKLQPVTARVTFYFDANGKLNTTEIVRTFNQPIPQ
jgi:hypothetical protein